MNTNNQKIAIAELSHRSKESVDISRHPNGERGYYTDMISAESQDITRKDLEKLDIKQIKEIAEDLKIARKKREEDTEPREKMEPYIYLCRLIILAMFGVWLLKKIF